MVGTARAYNKIVQVGWDNDGDMVNYVESSANTAGVALKTVVTLSGSTTNNAVNLATLFPGVTAAKDLTIRDITSSPGKATSISAHNSGTKLPMKARGVLSLTLNGGTPPTLYIDNSGAGSADLEITLIGS